MQKILIAFMSLFMICTSLVHADPTSSAINWSTDYIGALKQSKATSKPIVLFFTGSDWCGWCHKLQNESLNTSEFAQMAGNRFIFVEVDFPSKSNLPANVVAQNKQLQSKFAVRGFPSVIILDSNENILGKTGYQAGGGRAYAEHLFNMANIK